MLSLTCNDHVMWFNGGLTKKLTNSFIWSNRFISAAPFGQLSAHRISYEHVFKRAREVKNIKTETPA